MNLKLYKRDDIFSKPVKKQPDKLFEKLSNYHPNIKLIIKVNPSKLLGTKKKKIKNGITETSVVVKQSNLNHRSSAVPKKYKRNAIIGNLQRVHKISFNLCLILISKNANP